MRRRKTRTLRRFRCYQILHPGFSLPLFLHYFFLASFFYSPNFCYFFFYFYFEHFFYLCFRFRSRCCFFRCCWNLRKRRRRRNGRVTGTGKTLNMNSSWLVRNYFLLFLLVVSFL